MSRITTPASAEALRTGSAGVRVSFTWLGVRRALTLGQKARVAETFGAQEKDLSAAKRILDTRDPLFRQVTAVKHRVLAYWHAQTLPHPEPGVRLLRREQIQEFASTLERYREELRAAASALEVHYERLKADARRRLGSLYCEADYPPRIAGMFDVSHEIVSLEPPAYLLELSPEVYAQQQRRVEAKFQEAVALAEQAFLSELGQLVSHLVERLTGAGPGGEQKVFRDSAVSNITTFFDRFRSLNIGSSAELDRLVASAQQAIRGVRPQDLRDQDGLRKQVAGQMSGVLATLDGLLVDAPRRRILRPAATAPAAQPAA